MYWRFDEEIQHVELDYPRDLSIWHGVPYGIDAVFRYTDRKTYFFKGQNFWTFDDVRMTVVKREPSPIGEHWMHCPREIKDPFKSRENVSSGAAAGLTDREDAIHNILLLALLNFALVFKQNVEGGGRT
jgi:hypothetical protein